MQGMRTINVSDNNGITSQARQNEKVAKICRGSAPEKNCLPPCTTLQHNCHERYNLFLDQNASEIISGKLCLDPLRTLLRSTRPLDGFIGQGTRGGKGEGRDRKGKRWETHGREGIRERHPSVLCKNWHFIIIIIIIIIIIGGFIVRLLQLYVIGAYRVIRIVSKHRTLN